MAQRWGHRVLVTIHTSGSPVAWVWGRSAGGGIMRGPETLEIPTMCSHCNEKSEFLVHVRIGVQVVMLCLACAVGIEANPDHAHHHEEESQLARTTEGLVGSQGWQSGISGQGGYRSATGPQGNTSAQN